MPHVTSPEELFDHELQDIYYAENALTKALPALAKEATDRELKRAFKTHLRETEKHVRNLERVFTQMGKPVQSQVCPGIEGITKEHDEFVRGNGTSGSVLDMFLTGAAARAEHYEIAVYEGLLAKARALGHRDAVELLQENLSQEKDALKKVEAISKRLLKGAGSKGSAGGARKPRRSNSTTQASGPARRRRMAKS